MEIRGVLGMDFLQKYALEFDFSKGKFRLYEVAPPSWLDQGFKSTLHFVNGCPALNAQLGGFREELFTIDTGANVSTVRRSLFLSLVEKDQIFKGTTPSQVITQSGTYQKQVGFVKTVSLAGLKREVVRFDCDRTNLLGTTYLSRFIFRLDPQAMTVYIDKSDDFDKPECTATSGMSVLKSDSNLLVTKVEPGSPADFAGLQGGDQLQSVNGIPAREMDLFELRQLLTSVPGQALTIEFARDSVQKVSRLVLKSRIE
jgi:membrane-associated protease RseP (regulator of RpoE activity)